MLSSVPAVSTTVMRSPVSLPMIVQARAAHMYWPADEGHPPKWYSRVCQGAFGAAVPAWAGGELTKTARHINATSTGSRHFPVFILQPSPLTPQAILLGPCLRFSIWPAYADGAPAVGFLYFRRLPAFMTLP